MRLLIDIGNSCLKWCLYQHGENHSAGSIDYRLGFEPARWCEGLQLQPESVYLISVASPEITNAVIQACDNHWKIKTTTLQTQRYCAGVSNGYNEPLRLGVDRWAAVVAAYQMIKAAVLVVDSGTACTADLIDQNGLHLGGEIMVGRRLLQQSLSSGTSAIELPFSGNSLQEWGITTTACVEAGAISALCGFVERLQRRARSHLHCDVAVVLTGGDAPALLPHLESMVRYESDLVFRGMMLMAAEKNLGGEGR